MNPKPGGDVSRRSPFFFFPQFFMRSLKTFDDTRIILNKLVLELGAYGQSKGFTHSIRNRWFEIEKRAAKMTEMWNSRLDRLDKSLKDDEYSTARGKAH